MTQIPREIDHKLRQEIIIRIQRYARKFHRLEMSDDPLGKEASRARKEANRKVEEWFLALLHQVEKEARIEELKYISLSPEYPMSPETFYKLQDRLKALEGSDGYEQPYESETPAKLNMTHTTKPNFKSVEENTQDE